MNVYRYFKTLGMIVILGVFLIPVIWPIAGKALADPNFTAYLPMVTRAYSAKAGSGKVSNLQVITPDVARYERFEIQFDVQTVAANLDLPFDPAPPPGLQAGLGVTVNALFTHDNWQTAQIQPAFRYQPYQHTIKDNKDHFTPSGAPHWAVRFAPQQAGAWQFRILVEDQSGVVYFPDNQAPAFSFTVGASSANPYTRRGFLRVSATDPRYFEFQDGTPFVGVGFNDGYKTSLDGEAKMQSYEQNKMDLMRVWLTGASINASQWSSWSSHHLPYDGYLPGVKFDIHQTYAGADVSMVLDSSNPCTFTDYGQGGIPAEPNTHYKVSARVKLADVTGPASSGPYGFLIKQADWLGQDCNQASQGDLIAGPIQGTTGWATITGDYTTGSGQYWLDYLYLTLQNATGGTVYIDEVRVWRANDPAQVNLLREPNANSHLYFDQMNSAQWDLFLDSAERHGVYLKLVIDEKNEWIRNHIGPDGLMTEAGSNDNFYAAPNTKVRWLEQAWWRYLIARWGYSTAIHSFEYINEGDPYNGNLHEAADSMARYIHEHDPSRHMATTSFWASFPNAEFWSNIQYSDIDYADIHAYISTGWGLNASFLSSSLIETNPQNIHSGNASARLAAAYSGSEGISPRGMVIRGAGEWIVRYWMKADAFATDCPYATTGGMQRIRWMLDNGTYWGGREGVVPFNAQGQDYVCTSPAGSFGWTQFSSTRDRNGNLLPSEYRIVLNDNDPHELSLSIENSHGTVGTAWIDDVELVSPGGKIQPVLGQFDITPMDEDTAWYNRAYAEMWGGASLVGAHKPLMRGETGIDSPSQQDWNRDLLRDTAGIWLHNNVWGQINPGGMSDLFWWSDLTIPPSIYNNFLSYRNFMEDIPFNNGNYRDVGAQVSNAQLRAWGQRDDTHGRIHLWIQNTQHTWKRVINGPAITPISGSVVIPNVPAGNYRVEWWSTYNVSNPVFLTQTLTSNGSLTLTLPAALSDDVAVKIEKIP